MGNWHCVPSSCATVEYREYLPPRVRWRYGAEPWEEIAGDDYTTELIEIDKFPYLERVEVIPWAYDVRWGFLIDSNDLGLLLVKKLIPSNCLNIYKNSITSIIPNDFFSITNTPENGFNLIAQICSSPDCLPPEYQVICDCTGGCESCPDGTCPIQCGDHVCCYNDYGVSILEIPLADYCGGNS